MNRKQRKIEFKIVYANIDNRDGRKFVSLRVEARRVRRSEVNEVIVNTIMMAHLTLKGL